MKSHRITVITVLHVGTCITFLGNPSNSFFHTLGMNVCTKFHGNLSVQKVVGWLTDWLTDWPTNNAIPRAMPLALSLVVDYCGYSHQWQISLVLLSVQYLVWHQLCSLRTPTTPLNVLSSALGLHKDWLSIFMLPITYDLRANFTKLSVCYLWSKTFAFWDVMKISVSRVC